MHQALQETRDQWLDEVKLTATDTLKRVKYKAEKLGQFNAEDDSVINLCMGYLYLLSVCQENELFVRDEPSWYLIKNINEEIIH